jgi:AraC family ethanolamine operon transcriptional activator
MTLPGPLYVRLRSGHEQLVAFSSIQVLKQSMSEEDYATLEGLAVRHRANAPPKLLHRFAKWMAETLDVFQATPALATSPQCLCEVSEDLVSYLTTIAHSVADQPARATAPVRREGLQRALEYLRGQRTSNTRVAQLCAESGLSERSLQYAFREAFNMSPREFMIRRRLHFVRQALLQGGSGHRAVSTVAVAHGFYELGRFAGRYREFFGELPSTTLQRRDRFSGRPG